MTEPTVKRAPRAVLFAILAAGMLARIGYGLAQPQVDPAWNRPGLDGAYYVAWARALAGGGEAPGGAFYLAPLYPYTLGGFFRLFGENLLLLFFLQAAAMVVTAGLLATYAAKRGGERAGLVTAAFALLYHPALFFAARPVGETLALLLTAAAIVAAGGSGTRNTVGAGFLSGLGALARPNILLVPLAWAAIALARRRWREAFLLVAALCAVLAPVAMRNLRASGHVVPISSNGGITFFHGNGPGATGGFTLPRGLSGRVETQREEATTLASANAGKPLDPVAADAWWGAAAVRARIDDPAGTFRLLGWRVLLFLDNYEHGLDYAPALDRNPWRITAPIPLAVLFGCAAAGVAFVGLRGTGGGVLWGAFAASAAAPILFYAASRYRLPAAVLLCVPAGLGTAALFGAARSGGLGRRGTLALLCGTAVALASFAVPSGDLVRSEEAGALSNLADALQRNGDLEGAERAAREGIARDPSAPSPRFQLGVLLEKQGRRDEAERTYHDALDIDAGHAAAAANLARLLVERSEAAAAVPVLQRALLANPVDRLCWMNLVVALALTGDRREAIAAWHEAKRRGVAVEDGLLEAISGVPEGTPRPESESRRKAATERNQ